MTTLPNLTVPKDKARYSEASQIQEEIAKLLHAVEDSDRQVEDKAQWKPLPIQSAVANEVPALEPMIPELERKLAKLQQNKKMSAKEKAEELERPARNHCRDEDRTRSRQGCRRRQKHSAFRMARR